MTRFPVHVGASNAGADFAVTNFQVRACRASAEPWRQAAASPCLWMLPWLVEGALTPLPCLPHRWWQVETPDVSDEVLECPMLRHLLQPRPSPFVVSPVTQGLCPSFRGAVSLAPCPATLHAPCAACPQSALTPGPHCLMNTCQVNNNFGGGFVSDEDRVALSAIKFASGESAGAKCISSDDGQGDRWLEASMEQLCVPLPPWALRGGARETIWFNPAEVNAASECPACSKRTQACSGRLPDKTG